MNHKHKPWIRSSGAVDSFMSDEIALFFYRQRHIHHLAHLPLLAVGCYHHRPQARIIESNGCGGRGVQAVQGHAVAPDGGPALHDDERAAGDIGQRGQRLSWGDGGWDGDGVDDWIQFFTIPK
jgi:hypothetical protein